MRATPPVSIDTTTKLTSSTAADYYDPSAYAGGTTYALGAIIKVVADFRIYESLAASNTGNTPNVSPLWWRVISYTELAWSGATTYALGDTASANHRIYESLAAGNINHAVPVLPETLNDWWQDVGPTMKWAMFDLKSNTQTVTASPMTVVAAPGQRVNTVGWTGLEGNSLVVKATSVTGGGTVFPAPYDATTIYNTGDCMTVSLTTSYRCIADGTVGIAAPNASYWEAATGLVIDLNTREVADGYDYCFAPFSTLPSAVRFDIPPFTDVIVTTTLTSTSGNVKCGAMVLGTYTYLGATQYGATADAKNFSTITRNNYGDATLVPSRSLPLIDATLKLPGYRATKAKQARAALNAVPALYTWVDETDSDWFELGTIIGVYNKFSISPIVETMADVKIGIEEI